MAGEIIRQGDPTSHGGKVIEGSAFDICHGKPIAFIGHKVTCPKCKGIFPIVEGVPTTTFYGKGVAIAGMKAACGATLIATQFFDIVEFSTGGGDVQKSAKPASALSSERVSSPADPSAEQGNNASPSSSQIEEEHTYSLVDETGGLVDDYRYDLHCDEVLHTKAARYVETRTVSAIGVSDSHVVCWLAKDGASKS